MTELKQEVKKIQKELKNLGLMLPGGISTQWYTCCKKECKCMDKKNPEKHGPYHQLSYSIGGKSSTMIIKDKDLNSARGYLKNYKRFKELNKELLKANIALIRSEGLKQGKR